MNGIMYSIEMTLQMMNECSITCLIMHYEIDLVTHAGLFILMNVIVLIGKLSLSVFRNREIILEKQRNLYGDVFCMIRIIKLKNSLLFNRMIILKHR